MPSTIMTWARKALDRYSRQVGQYPYPTLVVAESSGAYAMESPALVWLPANYATYKIPFVLSHEIAHQWFYGVVGNDQTTNPFLDEAMAELLARSWFGFRASHCATRRLDLSMYAYTPSLLLRADLRPGLGVPEQAAQGHGQQPRSGVSCARSGMTIDTRS